MAADDRDSKDELHRWLPAERGRWPPNAAWPDRGLQHRAGTRRSSSFLSGADRRGGPPRQRLRCGALIERGENQEQQQDPYHKVWTVTGDPALMVEH